MKKIIFTIILILPALTCGSTSVVIDPNQWDTIQRDVAEFKFMAKVLCILASLFWGAITWRLILIAKSHKKFW